MSRNPSPLTMRSERLVREWIDTRPGLYIGTGPTDVIKKAWADSGIEMGCPQFGDQLHVLGYRPVELPAIPDPWHTRDKIPQWELRIPHLQVVGGRDHG